MPGRIWKAALLAGAAYALMAALHAAARRAARQSMH